ncbi:MAG: hypothetical protein APF76_07415 [Desulfitibacter sp. BRH_c19]|nr:MAG: hypothetical protein APF76_07415 [Desulfitibacter sp. BRH_c19]
MKKILVIICFILIILGILLFSSHYYLEVRVNGSEELVYQQKAKLDDEFDIYWTHSVTLQPVIESYKLQAPGIISMEKMIFDDNGPNLPAHPEYNQVWTIKDGKFIVTGYDRVFERVPVTIGAVIADHKLIYNGKTTSLKKAFKPGGFVHVGIANKMFIEYLVKEVEIWLTKR